MHAVDDPVFSIKNGVQIIPGYAKVGYLVNLYHEEGKIPSCIYRLEMDHVVA